MILPVYTAFILAGKMLGMIYPGDKPRMLGVSEPINWFFHVSNKALYIVLPLFLLIVHFVLLHILPT
jgi:hypothetical protein